jgi:hypothetical protein
MAFCTACGIRLAPEARFCGDCGIATKKTSEASDPTTSNAAQRNPFLESGGHSGDEMSSWPPSKPIPLESSYLASGMRANDPPPQGVNASIPVLQSNAEVDVDIKQLPFSSKIQITWGVFWRIAVVNLLVSVLAGFVGGFFGAIFSNYVGLAMMLALITGILMAFCGFYAFLRWIFASTIGRFRIVLIRV